MDAIAAILHELDERTLAQTVGLPHDEVRMAFCLQRNTVSSFDEFSRIIGDYLNHHMAECMIGGGSFRPAEARSRAKEVLEREYRKKRKDADIVTAFNDARDGTNGGLRVVLDAICDALKAEAISNHTRDVFDRYVAPSSWESKVEIIRQFIARCGVDLSGAIRADQPERYARDYKVLIEAYVDGLRKTGAIFRQL